MDDDDSTLLAIRLGEVFEAASCYCCPAAARGLVPAWSAVIGFAPIYCFWMAASFCSMTLCRWFRGGPPAAEAPVPPAPAAASAIKF